MKRKLIRPGITEGEWISTGDNDFVSTGSNVVCRFYGDRNDFANKKANATFIASGPKGFEWMEKEWNELNDYYEIGFYPMQTQVLKRKLQELESILLSAGYMIQNQ